MAEATTGAPQEVRRLFPGDPAPWFVARSTANPRFHLHTVAGRHLLLFFFGSASDAQVRAALNQLCLAPGQFDDERISFFGVSVDPADEREGRLPVGPPGVHHFWDFDAEASRLYGVVDEAGDLHAQAFLLDPMLRVLAVLPFDEAGAFLARAKDALRAVPRPAGNAEHSAPVLQLPRVFEPEFCRHLVSLYEQHGGEDSGFMREVDGKTIGLVDHRHKRRSDHVIQDERVRHAARARILRRIVPEVHKAFQFRTTRMERYIVACYDAEVGGHFRPHRDNTTKGTAHRRFAVTINLNAEGYEGGDLRFPEFGRATYRAPTGGAVVFSCGLLHEATPVTAGRRYAFLPFLYDEEAARIREANNPHLGQGVNSYRAGGGTSAGAET